MPAPTLDDAQRRRNRIKLLAILAVCAAPVIASYFTYYVIKPDGRTNYGELIEPQRSLASLALAATGAAPDPGLAAMRGKWLLITLADEGCDAACEQRLVVMRQVRLTTGKDRDRVERALLVAGSPPPPAVLTEHEGLQVVATDRESLERLRQAAGATAPGILIVDPLGNLMMRYPTEPDPNRMKKDLAKLLRASRVG
jgi:hypothetical protein